jgi:L-threonylcarbamoyladenylate synthase
MAQIISLNENPTETVRLAAEALNTGGIIVFPTDTVYGLMVRPMQSKDTERLNAAKDRQLDKPIAALAAEEPKLVEVMRSAVEPICGAHPNELIPGALTIVMALELWQDTLPRGLNKLPYKQIGVRVPRHAALQELLRACGGWLMATSANKEGMPTPHTLSAVHDQLGEGAGMSLAVDGGECANEASGVVLVTAKGLEIIRNHPLLLHR